MDYAWRHLVTCDLVLKKAKVNQLIVLGVILIYKILFLVFLRFL